MTLNEMEMAKIKNDINILNQNNISDTLYNLDYLCERVKESTSNILVSMEACKKMDDLNDDALFLQEETKAICHEIMDML